MDLSVSLDAKEVLFHLNYMGYRNVTAVELKGFMKDLKKLMKYESKEQTEDKKLDTDKVVASVPSVSAQITNKHYDTHTVSSKMKERKIDKTKERSRPNSAIPSDKTNLVPSTLTAQKPEPKKHLRECHKILEKNKENIPVPAAKGKEARTNAIDNEQARHLNPPTGKMWIRSRSAQSTKRPKKTDPVSLYQAYQRDWDRFRSQICESSHSDLRWLIREKMLGDKE